MQATTTLDLQQCAAEVEQQRQANAAPVAEEIDVKTGEEDELNLVQVTRDPAIARSFQTST